VRARRLGTLVLLLGGAAAAGTTSVMTGATPEDRTIARPDALTFALAASKSRYALGEQVQLRLTLRLGPRAARNVSVSVFPYGTVHVVRATRNGQPIPGARTVVDFEEDPLLVQVERLRTLRPGQAAQIPFDVELDGRRGSRLSDVILRRNQQHTAVVYKLAGPGRYTVQLAYEYAGAAGGRGNVFRDRLLSNAITFQVVR
jgi:hypothetical protein